MPVSAFDSQCGLKSIGAAQCAFPSCAQQRAPSLSYSRANFDALHEVAEVQAAFSQHSWCSSRNNGMQVPDAHIERLDVVPSIDAGAVLVTVLGSKMAEGAVAHVSVLDEHGDEVSSRVQASKAHLSCWYAHRWPLSSVFRRIALDQG